MSVSSIEQAIAHCEATIDRCFGEFQAALEKGLRRQRRLVFIGTVTLLIPLIGLWMRG